MSGDSPAFDALRPRWQHLLPKRWLPIVLYASWLLLLIVLAGFAGEDFDSDSLIFSLVPIAILAAMSRTPIWVRLLIIFGMPVAHLAIGAILRHPRIPNPSSIRVATDEFLDDLPRTLNNFALTAVVAHLLTNVIGAHVSAKTATESASAHGTKGTIKDWLYFMTLVGLMLMPKRRVVLTGLAAFFDSLFGDLFAELAFYLYVTGICIQISTVVVGMVLLTPFSAWRFQLLALLVLTTGIFGFALCFNSSLLDLEAVLSQCLLIFVISGITLPFWLLLRWAGYRLHLPHRWWWSRA